ncbi:MAG: hypothetical protein HXY22_04555 [Alphaproteobacteria bacterium]|nr:hypothetical protein [Alphaproteobacteria bacterium]
MTITVYERNIFTGRVTEHPATGQPPADLRDGQCIRVAYTSRGRDFCHWVPVAADPARPSSYLTGGGQHVQIWAGVTP